MEAARADDAAVQRERPEAGRRFMRRTARNRSGARVPKKSKRARTAPVKACSE